jgi:glycosyltransferase involved in cell wall biosynthesis
MKLVFYYHIPIYIEGKNLLCPSYFGVFIDSIAKNVDELIVVGHLSPKNTANDYKLQQSNIIFVSLGEKKPSWHRMLFHKKTLQNVLKSISNFDAFLVRAPSPLAPFFCKYIPNKKIFFLVVGDYHDSIKQAKQSTIRDWVAYYFTINSDYLFKKRIKKNTVFVNSPELFSKYGPICKRLELVKTTTIKAEDFYYREDTCLDKTLNLLYCGRIDFAKGLTELLDAVAKLIVNGIESKLTIVGWEDNPAKPIETFLKQKASDLKIEKHIVFSGKKKVGDELNSVYRNADIFIIPSYQEGFPRVIWEAMANSLPVIATRVGGIPHTVTSDENCILIDPKNPNQIFDAVLRIKNDDTIRKKLISNGRALAQDATLEVQSEKIINLIKRKS